MNEMGATRLREIGLNGRAAHAMYRWVALSLLAVCTVAACAVAQENGDIPDIRVETRQVLIPTMVSVFVPDRNYYGGTLRGYYNVLQLGVHDFHVFEDEKEQTVISAALVRPYWTNLLQDNLGYQQGITLTRSGEWKDLRVSPVNPSLPFPLYVIAYGPPLSPEGSCHEIKVAVDPKDASGNKLTMAESGAELFGNAFEPAREEEVKRSKLLLRYRTQYCNVAHAASDPLYGTPISKELENLATDDKAEEEGFYVNAFALFDESSKSRIHLALDFPNLSDQTRSSGFQAVLLGMFNSAKGGQEARFSDSKVQGCHFPWKGSAAEIRLQCGKEYFYNHYETEADLPPGNYDLRVGIDFGGVLRRAEVPVGVPAPTQRLAVSGIALCRRFFPHDQIPSEPQLPLDGILTMPFDLKPLVSKGLEFTPTGDTHFKVNDFMAVYFEVFDPLLEEAQLLPDGGDAHAQFEMRVVDVKTGEVKSDTGFRAADSFVNPGSSVIPISERVAIGNLAPGNYQIQVRATDSTGTVTDWRTTSFTRE